MKYFCRIDSLNSQKDFRNKVKEFGGEVLRCGEKSFFALVECSKEAAESLRKLEFVGYVEPEYLHYDNEDDLF